MRKLHVALAALLALFVLAAVAAWTFPADVAYAWFGKRLQPATLADLSGDLWSGHAGSLRVLGREIGSVDWHLARLPLLRGDLVAEVDVKGAGGTAHGALRQNPDLTLDVRDAVIRLPAATLEPAFGVPALRLRGDVEIALVHARLRGVWVEAVDGSAIWHDAAVAGAAQARLSDLRVDFATQADGRIVCTVRDLGGPLAAEGHCEFRAGAYAAEVKLAARDGDARVLDALQYVGQPQADGSVLLKIQGHLLQLF
jgi:general secretion pathway protein N